MNPYHFKIVVGNHRDEPIPATIAEQIQSKFLPKLTKKLQKAGYPAGNYLIIYHNLWNLEHKDIYTREHRDLLDGPAKLGRSACIFRQSGYRGDAYDIITGGMDCMWECRGYDDHIMVQTEGYDLTEEMTAQTTKVTVNISLLPRLEQEDSSTDLESEEEASNILPFVKFPYELECEWPDVIVTCFFSKPVTDDTIQAVQSVVHGFVGEWNAPLDDSEDFIDYVGDAEAGEDQTSVDIHIDFGPCDPDKVLMPFITHLSNSPLPIQRLLLT